MIAQVDEALCRLLRPCLPAGTQIRLDPPKPAWQTESQVRSVELFLFALHDDAVEGETREGKRAARCANPVTSVVLSTSTRIRTPSGARTSSAESG